MTELNINKLIFKTAITTLIGVVVLSIISFIILTLFSPITVARTASSLGLDNISLSYYQKAYDKSQDVNDLYNMLNKAITVNNYSKVVCGFETLYNEGNEDYYDFIDYINNFNLTSVNGMLLKTYVFNEDARLKSHYVNALINNQQTEDALLFAVEDLQTDNLLTEEFRYNFVLGTYLTYLIESGAPGNSFTELENYNYNETNINLMLTTANYVSDLLTAVEYMQTTYLNPTENQNLITATLAMRAIETITIVTELDTYFNAYVNISALEAERQSLVVLFNNLTT